MSAYPVEAEQPIIDALGERQGWIKVSPTAIATTVLSALTDAGWSIVYPKPASVLTVPDPDERPDPALIGFVEDGLTIDDTGEPIAGRFWACSRFKGTVSNGRPVLFPLDMETFLSWDQWGLWESNLSTRQQAIDAAMKASQ